EVSRRSAATLPGKNFTETRCCPPADLTWPVLVLNPHSRAGNGQGAALPGIGSANLTSKSAMAQSCAAQAPRAHTDRRRFFLQTHPARRRYVAVTICIANNYSNWH